MMQKPRGARMLMNFRCIQSNDYQAYFLNIYFWNEFKWSLKNTIQIRGILFLVSTIVLQEFRCNKTLLQSFMSRTPRIRPIECNKNIFPIHIKNTLQAAAWQKLLSLINKNKLNFLPTDHSATRCLLKFVPWLWFTVNHLHK